MLFYKHNQPHRRPMLSVVQSTQMLSPRRLLGFRRSKVLGIFCCKSISHGNPSATLESM